MGIDCQETPFAPGHSQNHFRAAKSVPVSSLYPNVGTLLSKYHQVEPQSCTILRHYGGKKTEIRSSLVQLERNLPFRLDSKNKEAEKNFSIPSMKMDHIKYYQ